MLYALCDWEQNGYHDSYFYLGLWDSETKRVTAYEYAATAYPGGRYPENLQPLNDEVIEEARAWLKDAILARLLKDEDRRIFNPTHQEIQRSGDVVLKTDYKGRKNPHVVKAGEVGRVMNVFPGYAYNTYTVRVDFGGGRIINIGTDRLQLNEKVDTEACIRDADEMSHGHQYRGVFFGGWDTKNFVLQYLKNK